MTLSIAETAYAKINLYLHVTGKREDGYHLLDSLVVFPDVGDCLTIIDSAPHQKEHVSLHITGPFSDSLQTTDPSNNLIIKAAHKLIESVHHTLPPVTVCLEKNLPVASGIGGGSSDAAATLRLLIRHWNLTLSEQKLSEIAIQLGADVPVCITPIPQRMEGIGEVLSQVSGIPPFGMILVNHGEAVSTADIFRARHAEFSKRTDLSPNFASIDLFIDTLSQLTNDLEAPACVLNPKIATVLKTIKELPSCRLARMSGSGATCFGLFNTVEQAVKASKLLSQHYPWWIWGGEGISHNK